MFIPFIVYINRETLTAIKNFISSVNIFFTTMTTDGDIPAQSSSEPPPFDPKKPAVPISYPLKTLDELESRSYFDSFHFPFNKSSVPIRESDVAMPDRPRALVCHDMAGGYSDDKWIQGGNNPDSYGIWHWHLIDVFVYFSHNLVDLPPPSWTNTAHNHGVKVLGTFITEWDEGAVIAKKLLSTKESAHLYAERLSELAAALGFDGWLINMEVRLEISKIPNLLEFVSHLTKTMHSAVPGSLVIWYDSVTTDGNLSWQNQLNSKNKPFFDLCDGIFINYSWRESYAKQSGDVSGDRRYDVYMGIDVFGRGTFGGGQWTTNVALDAIKKADVSAAIFAPGWVYETNQPPNFETAQNRWWGLVEDSWKISKNYPTELPFYSNFDQGRGHHIFVDGVAVSDSPWNNLSSQTFQPHLKFSGDPSLDPIKVSVDFKEASYNGGGNLLFKGTLEGNAYFTTRLFQGELPLGIAPIHFTYSVKSDGTSAVGLALEFSSLTDKKKASILLSSYGNTLITLTRFSSKFSNIIMPRRVTESESSPGWVIQESSIAMNGYTLTEIHALCYKSIPEVNPLTSGPSQYSALLGHVTLKTPSQKPDFPPADSWLIESQNVEWVPGKKGSKTVSVKIVWGLKDGSIPTFKKYNVYVEKYGEGLNGKFEYIGVANVRALYASEIPVPAGSSSVKFVIQVCGVDGSWQKLEDSPAYELAYELTIEG